MGRIARCTAMMIIALSARPADVAVAQSPPDLAVAKSPLDPAVAQSPAARRGLRFVKVHCARCHAIDKVGASPLAMAPPFHTLHLKYPVADLQRPLTQGVHPTMPRFWLEPHQVDDVMAYLRTLKP